MRMKTFLALYMAPVESFAEWMKMPPEQQKSGMEAWTTWMQEHERSFVEEGAQLGTTTRVTAEGVSDVKNEIGGYSIVQAASAKDAVKIFDDSPHLQMSGAWVELMECLPMPSP